MIALNRALVLALLLAVTACGGKPPPAAPAADPRAAQDLATYRELLGANSLEFAITVGREIQRNHPGTPAAAEVAATLPDIEARFAAGNAAKRLAALWDYQTGVQAGGAQSAASIFSTEPSGAAQVRFIFRRHADWGRSAYLYAGGGGFDCPDPCSVLLRFDGAPGTRWKAHLPETGEPAIFIDDDVALAAKLPGTKRLEIEATLRDQGPVTMVFEPGGFVPAKWVELPAK